MVGIEKSSIMLVLKFLKNNKIDGRPVSILEAFKNVPKPAKDDKVDFLLNHKQKT